MTKKTILFIATFSIAVAIFFSCQPEFDGKQKTEPFTVATAKEYLQTAPELKDMKFILHWDYAIAHTSAGSQVVEVPLQETATIFLNKKQLASPKEIDDVLNATEFRLVFVKKSNEIKMMKLYYVPEINYLRSKNFDIGGVYFGAIENPFSGLIIAKNLDDSLINVFDVKTQKIVGNYVHTLKKSSEPIEDTKLYAKTMTLHAANKIEDMDGGQLNTVYITNNYSSNYSSSPSYYSFNYYPSSSSSYTTNPYTPGTGGGRGGGGGGTSEASSFETTYKITNSLGVGRVNCIYQKLMNSSSKFSAGALKY